MSIFKQILEPRPAGPGDPALPAAEEPESWLRLRRVRQLGGAAMRALRLLPELAILGGGAGLLDFWTLSRNGWANVYYAAAVRSMAANWHNFFYASFDPKGVMTIDKPPLALWIEALSVRLFGYHSLSMLIPEAVIGVLTVLLLYDLVRRFFGRIAGFVAGAALATTPITVAMSRHNNPDALVALLCVAALWFFARAIQDGRTRWIVLAGTMVGLGFETKMGVALVVVPGIVAAWLWLRPRGLHHALDQLLFGGLALLLVAAAWPLLIASTPAGQRPWVAGTGDNSILSLIFNYNGFGRVTGQNGGPTGALGVFGGTIGPVRLLNSALGGQGGWLLGLALAGLLAAAIASRLQRSDPRTGWVIAVGGSFVTAAVLFSVAQGIFHPYYVSLLAPFTAAIVGAAVGVLMSWRLGPRFVGALLGVGAIVAAVAVEFVVLADYGGQLTWVQPLLLATGGVACVLLAAFTDVRVRGLALVAAVGALLVAPSIWSVDTLAYATSSTFPAGGPAADNTAEAFITVPNTAPFFGGGFTRRFGFGGATPAGPPGRGFSASPAVRVPGSFAPRFGGGPGFGGARAPGQGFGTPTSILRDAGLQKILAYVKVHGGGPLAVSSQSTAATAIILQHADIAGLGGFSGEESSPTISWFAHEVAIGNVRWVYDDGTGNFGAPADGRRGARAVLSAVTRACKLIDTGSGPREDYVRLARLYGVGLFDCAGDSAALAATG